MAVSIFGEDSLDYDAPEPLRLELLKFHPGCHLWTTDSKKLAEEVVSCDPIDDTLDFQRPYWSEDYFGSLEVVCLNDFELEGKN